MNPDAYRSVFVASLAGGVAGALVMWNRRRSRTAGDSRLRQAAVLTAGTAAFAVALTSIGRAFGPRSWIHAAAVLILTTGWVAVLHSVARLPVPRALLRVRAGEFELLRGRWTGVRCFGELLRRTPLRHLGGPVYLSEGGRNPQTVLDGMRDAQAVHLWALVFGCPWLLYWSMQGWWTSLVAGLLVQAPLNVYPILHLRHAMRRLDLYLARRQRRAATGHGRAADVSPAGRPGARSAPSAGDHRG